MTSLVLPILAAASSLSLAPGPAAPNAVVDWTVIADGTPIAGGPNIRNRINAMTQVAVHDALNAIRPQYDSYTDGLTAAEGASPEAAVAAAAYRVLSQAVPAQSAGLATTYDAYVAALPECRAAYPSCHDDGEAVGFAAADAILAARAGDGSAVPHLPYTLAPAPGVYQPTPPGFAAPQFAGWAFVTPFVIRSGDQFRVDPSKIFDLTSKAYTRDFLEVRRVGRVDAEATGQRTADQSEIARFWPGGGANLNAITRAILASRPVDLWAAARLFALVNVASHDAAVAAFDTKYTYNFWRPVTAIRGADSDGNPDTIADTDWLWYQPTPPYPDYVCGLTTNVGSGAEVLRRFYGTDTLPYTLTAGAATRSFATLSDAEAESVGARVFGGMHFRAGCVQGIRLGNRVGCFVFRHALRPLKPHKR